MTNRIKELREARGLTLQEVADVAGTSLQQIQRLENGYRRLTDEWMRRIAPILRVHPAELLLDLSPRKYDLTQPVDEVFITEWWRTLSLEEQARWILRFGKESGISTFSPRPRRSLHQAKQRQA